MRLLCLLGILSLIRSEVQGVDDFHNFNHGYDFYLHDLQNLLLGMRGNHCYYIRSPDNINFYWLQLKMQLENYIIRVIEGRDEGIVTLSSLDAMRTEFSDLLANFLCEGKTIYHVLLKDPLPHLP